MATLAEAFANSCHDAARWRAGKGSEDGDVRHLHCVEALRTAASWAVKERDAEEQLQRLLLDVAISEDGRLLLAHNAQRLFASYCFEGPEELDGWLRRVAAAQYQEEYDSRQQQLMGDGT